MAEKGFGVKEINLIGPSGTPTITSPNNLNLNAVNVAISTNVSIGGTLSVTGNVSIGGTLTYEDVTNIDSVGLITARNGLNVTAGVSTFAGEIHGNNQRLGSLSSSGRFNGLFLNDGTSYYGSNKLFVSSNSGFGLEAYGDMDSYLKANTGGGTDGNCYIRTGSSSGGYVFVNGDNGVELHHAGTSNKKFETTSSGATVTGTLTATTFSGSGASLTNLPATDPTNSDIQVVYTVTANGSSAYRFAGNGVVSTADNPALYLIRGQKYRFINNSGGSHPFQIREASGGTAYSTGVTNNGAASGNIDFAPTYDSPAQLVYQCTSHGGMVGSIYLRDAAGNNTNVGVTTMSGNLTINSSASAKAIILPDNKRIYFGDGEDFWIGSNGTNGEVSGSLFYYNHQYYYDNVRLRIGNGQDLELFHNGTDSYIDNNTGNLYLDSASNIIFETGSSTERVRITSTGEVNIGGNYTQTTAPLSVTTDANDFGFRLLTGSNAVCDILNNDAAGNCEIRGYYNNNSGTRGEGYRLEANGRTFFNPGGNGGLSIKSDGKASLGNTGGSGTGALTIYPNSITGMGRLDVYGGGDENSQTQARNEVMRIGRGDILDSYYHSIWSATGSGGSNSHFLKFYASNGNAGATNQKEALSMNGEGYVTKVSQPRALVKISSTTTISNGKVTNWASPTYNVGSLWDTSNYRFVAPVTGLYLVGGNFRIGAPGKVRVIRFALKAYNTSNVQMAGYGGGTGGGNNYDGGSSGYDHPYVSFTNAIYLQTGQYLELHFEEVGTEYTTYIQTSNEQSHMWCVLLQ